jgi:hypothetical protein
VHYLEKLAHTNRDEKIWCTQHKNNNNKHNGLEIVTAGRGWYNTYLKKYVIINFRMLHDKKK